MYVSAMDIVDLTVNCLAENMHKGICYKSRAFVVK